METKYEKLRRRKDEYEAELRSAERAHEDELRDKRDEWRKEEKEESRRIRVTRSKNGKPNGEKLTQGQRISFKGNEGRF